SDRDWSSDVCSSDLSPRSSFFLEKLAKQRVMQVQSASDPPKKLDLGERAVMADGNEYNLLQIKAKNGPVEIVYPVEGTPFVVGRSEERRVGKGGRSG